MPATSSKLCPALVSCAFCDERWPDRALRASSHLACEPDLTRDYKADATLSRIALAVAAAKMAKFSTLNGAGEEVAFSYGNCFFRQPLSPGARLTIGPAALHVDTLVALAATWPTQQYYVLYVLLISHSGARHGRYQSPLIESFADLQAFLGIHQRFFEADGRHHVWIASANNEGTLVYDQHNVIFAYGDLPRYEVVLCERGFSEREFWFPCPHCHSYPSTHAADEEKLLAHFPWQFSPLQPGDVYD
jgi:hypothetical protein